MPLSFEILGFGGESTFRELKPVDKKPMSSSPTLYIRTEDGSSFRINISVNQIHVSTVNDIDISVDSTGLIFKNKK